MKKTLSLILAAVLVLTSFSALATETMMKDGKMIDTSMKRDDKMMMSRYLDYAPWIVSKYVKAGKTVVLFFHANRCPTCVSLDKDVMDNMKKIPENVVIIKANYDTAKNLKKLYKIKSQNSLVVVNKKGKIVARSKGATTTLKDLLALIK